MTALQPSGCWAELDQTSDRPQKAHHFAGDRGDNDGLRLACGREPAITGAKPDLAFQAMPPEQPAKLQTIRLLPSIL